MASDGFKLWTGMPYPKNLKTAKEVEAIVRENGAVPATVAILDGLPCIGIFMLNSLFSFSVHGNEKAPFITVLQ